jgi:hypothetical protein
MTLEFTGYDIVNHAGLHSLCHNVGVGLELSCLLRLPLASDLLIDSVITRYARDLTIDEQTLPRAWLKSTG